MGWFKSGSASGILLHAHQPANLPYYPSLLGHKKPAQWRVSKFVHLCHSPRDTAMRSVPKLKQLVRKKSSHFLSK
jgi:hypothetical protein